MYKIGHINIASKLMMYMFISVTHENACLVKVDIPCSITFFHRTPIFEWYVVRFGFSDGY